LFSSFGKLYLCPHSNPIAMRFLYSIIFGITVSVLFSCNGESASTQSGEEKTTAPNGLKGYIQIDLSAHGFPLKTWIPDTSKTDNGTMLRTKIGVNDYGELEIKVGRNHQVKIVEGGDLELKRTDLDDHLVFNAKMLKETDGGFLYRLQAKDTLAGVPNQYHFYTVLNLGGIDYEFQDIDEGEAYSEDGIESMFKTVMNTSPIPKANS